MLRNPGIESVLRRELDSLPLPPEAEWFPSRERESTWSTCAWLVTGSLLIGIALFVGPAVRDWRDALSPGTAARQTAAAPPTLVRPQTSPLRNLVRDAVMGYNVALPANWRESARGHGAIPGGVLLIGRASYTARSAVEEAATISRYTQSPLFTLPWDVTAELWLRNSGLSTLELARARAGCSATCTVGEAQINGVTFLTTIDNATGVHAFYVDRGDRVLVFSYVVGNAADQPVGVTVDTLEQIVRSVGLP